MFKVGRWCGVLAPALLCFGSAALAADKFYPAAILPFQERGVDVKGAGEKVTDLLFAHLVARPEMYLVDREDLNKIIAELELNLSGLVKPDQAMRVGQLTGAKILITGSVLQIDGRMYVVAKIVGTETTRVLGASVKGNIRDDLDGLVEQLAGSIAETVGERADELVAKPVTRDDRISRLKKALGDAKRPVVQVKIEERHVGQLVIDPAAETEIALTCRELGFELIDPDRDHARKADVMLVGEGFSEFGGRLGNLNCVKARVELKAVDTRTGAILAIDRQTAVTVDLTEQIAGKTALQEAAAELAERILPRMVKATEPQTP